jgi:hypothetical protein
MKTRKGFVSNSSSSSFVLITSGGFSIYESVSEEDIGSDPGEYVEETRTMDIDDMILKLQNAKAAGQTKVCIEMGEYPS